MRTVKVFSVIPRGMGAVTSVYCTGTTVGFFMHAYGHKHNVVFGSEVSLCFSELFNHYCTGNTRPGPQTLALRQQPGQGPATTPGNPITAGQGKTGDPCHQHSGHPQGQE